MDVLLIEQLQLTDRNNETDRNWEAIARSCTDSQQTDVMNLLGSVGYNSYFKGPISTCQGMQ